ncbi:sensor histidine kinase [Sphingobacterium griseoflavum]|uniref:histidine kinase n=1 Tax=Sphingobacterium griseoflavum TaxID=1474952 RepID=A0ABQ3HUN3_9SPHI|nr:7TM diverse intracellular signaling domain-containing protein [Sphingobacterium griseoflavum]GHE33251.1 hypothetical protein GCM10017764_15420 [Sphingobacterium griseoflavum]
MVTENIARQIDLGLEKSVMAFRIFFLAYLFLGSWSISVAQPTIQTTSQHVINYFGKAVSIFQDSSNNLTLADILSKDSLFRRSTMIVPNFGVSKFNNWIKFKVVDRTADASLVLNISNPVIDEITLYTIQGSNIDSTVLQLADSLGKRRFDHQFYTFHLALEKDEPAICYLKVAGTKQVLVPMTLSDERAVVGEISRFDFRSGIYVGIMLTMLLYNLFLYFSAGDRHYLVYVHYIFWVAVAQVAILGYFQRFFPNSILASRHLITFAGAMSGIASVIFVKSFLNVRGYAPKLLKWLNLVIIGDVIALSLLLFNKPVISYNTVNFVAATGSVIVLLTALRTYKNGNKSAKLFLIAWGIFLGSVIIYVLKDYGILPYNLWTAHIVQIGASLEALLLSFALGDKINLYRKEKDASQARELASSLENERLIREQNTLLEKKVEERTRALTDSNESLHEALRDLKDAQSQLVEAEKMASLGQLTAGVAHEINNPINFVTSNVAPLKRDINMVWETLDAIEQMAFDENLALAEKKERIQLFKEEIDIDYLKTEVDFLLKGMHDGAHRTAEIVKSLRIFSRVDEDTVKFADINEGLESTMVILGSLVRDGIEVEKIYGDLPKVECHAGKLNQVFLNVLTNAIYAINEKFKQESGGQLRIATGIHEEGVSVFIQIVDNGIGIPEEIREKIFEPFFTTKDVGEGTGLGMSIAYNTIAKHHGKIIVDSTVGEGTSFTLVIPIEQNIL